jgi:hypothetical protein
MLIIEKFMSEYNDWSTNWRILGLCEIRNEVYMIDIRFSSNLHYLKALAVPLMNMNNIIFSQPLLTAD